jgi:hypothetical protein
LSWLLSVLSPLVAVVVDFQTYPDCPKIRAIVVGDAPEGNGPP